MRARIALTGLALASAFGAVAPPASPAPAGPPVTGAIVEEVALASWTFPTGERGRHLWYFAGAFRAAAPGGTSKTFAFAVKGVCREVRDRRATSCRGSGTGGPVPARHFEVDPALRDAHLDIGRGEVAWTAADRTVPYGYFAGEACQAGTGDGAGMQQPATATGRLFGRAAPRHAVDAALLARGAMVTECTRALLQRAASGHDVRVVFPND